MIKEINGKTEVLGLIGHPIEHTLSPVIHNTISGETGRNAAYVPFHVFDEADEGAVSDAGDIENVVKGAYKLGIKGLNVTVPYKSAVIPFLSEIDPLADKIGAVNTLVRTDKGYKGYNTDMPGLYMALQKRGIMIEGDTAVVLGAGGAARAVIAMLLHYKAERIYLVNRTYDKAAALADEMNKIFADDRKNGLGVIPISIDNIDSVKVSVHDSINESDNNSKNALDNGYLMFQCTSLGLKEGDGLLIDDDELYRMASYGFDLVYNPADTPFTKKMDELGIPSDNGLLMLLYQGVIAYQLWMNTEISDEVINRARISLCKSIYGNNIILTGYMGAGKSTVGKKLAEELGMDFIDTDEYLVEREGKTIPEIFEIYGEEAFRNIETSVLTELRENRYNTVIATGGGIVLREENRKLLKEMGRVFYLYATPETTFERVKNDTGRPLLNSESEKQLKQKIEDMIRVRYQAYSGTADYRIDTDGKTVEILVEEIKLNAQQTIG
jgi:Shikimate 5-dehydrogenase